MSAFISLSSTIKMSATPSQFSLDGRRRHGPCACVSATAVRRLFGLCPDRSPTLPKWESASGARLHRFIRAHSGRWPFDSRLRTSGAASGAVCLPHSRCHVSSPTSSRRHGTDRNMADSYGSPQARRSLRSGSGMNDDERASCKQIGNNPAA
jgi:hypothetical protein